MARPKLEFWFEFASTYSYLSAMRLPAMAQAAGVDVVWRSFLLGPIFERFGLSVEKPDPFPQNSLLAARVAQAAPEGAQKVAFCQNVYLMEFSEGQDISDPEVIAACVELAKLPEGIIEAAQSDENKHALRLSTEEAGRRGIFGAPNFVVGDELFWSDDRLEEALEWAVRDG